MRKTKDSKGKIGRRNKAKGIGDILSSLGQWDGVTQGKRLPHCCLFLHPCLVSPGMQSRNESMHYTETGRTCRPTVFLSDLGIESIPGGKSHCPEAEVMSESPAQHGWRPMTSSALFLPFLLQEAFSSPVMAHFWILDLESRGPLIQRKTEIRAIV